MSSLGISLSGEWTGKGRYLLTAPAYILLFLMITFPMVLQFLALKAALFILLIAIVIGVVLITGHLGLDRSVVLSVIVFAGFSFLSTVHGLFASTPGAIKYGQVFVLWPLVYLFLLGGVRKSGMFVVFEKIIVIATIFIALYGFCYFLMMMKIIPENRFLEGFAFEDENNIGLYDGYVQLMFPGLNSMPFLMPYLLTAFATDLGEQQWRFRRFWLSVALIFGTVLILIAGRRALLVVTFLTPFALLPLSRIQPSMRARITRRRIVLAFFVLLIAIVAILAIVNSFYHLEITSIWQLVSGGFDFSSTTYDRGANERRQQFFALVNGWMKHPFWGYGMGASAHGSIRSELMPWAYELFYVALLFQNGIVGFCIYGLTCLWLGSALVKVIRAGGVLSQIALPFFVGMFAFLIANATNPYLMRFDGLWVIFLPLAIVNLSRYRPIAIWREGVFQDQSAFGANRR